MNQFTTSYKNLDEPTRTYLGGVARTKGRGAPGIYVVGRTNAWPVISLTFGGVLLFFGFGLTLASPKAPWACALLLTSTTLLGGWMVLYPIRRWFFSGIGTFQFFDPHTVYESNSGEVTVTNVIDRTNMESTENFNNNSYTSTSIHFHLPGKTFTSNIASRRDAETVAEYYGYLFELGNDAAYQNFSPAELGAVAKYTVIEGQLPSDLKLVDLTVSEMPMVPDAKKIGTGLAIRLLVIVGAAVAIFSLSWMFLSPIQDEIAFADAGKYGVQGYRDYLLDERNTSHRDEARAKLKELYQPAIAKAGGCPNVAEKQAWTDLMTNLSEYEGLPVVSIAVTSETEKAHTTAMRAWMADALGSFFGPTHVVFVEPPEGSKAMVECMFDSVHDGREMSWMMTYRKSHDTIDSNAVKIPMRMATVSAGGMMASMGYPPELFKTAFFQQVFNTAAPTILTQPVVAGDSGN